MRHRFTQPIEVKTTTGRRYRLDANSDVELDLDVEWLKPEWKIPAGTPVTPTNGDTPGYKLAEQISVSFTPPEHRQLMLMIPANQVVERIPVGTGTGVTIEVDPQRAPGGELVTITIEKHLFPFAEAELSVCLQMPGENRPWVASEDVELTKIEVGKAVLLARIPKLPSSIWSQPVNLLVVAQTPDGKLAEVISQEFAVSSKGWAAICWLIAFLVPWAIAGAIVYRQGLEQPFNPIWFTAGKNGKASLSLAQILLWTILIFSASFYVLVASGNLLALTNEVLMLLGITGGSSVIAKITAASKDKNGQFPLDLPSRDPHWMDLFRTGGRPDLYTRHDCDNEAPVVIWTSP